MDQNESQMWLKDFIWIIRRLVSACVWGVCLAVWTVVYVRGLYMWTTVQGELDHFFKEIKTFILFIKLIISNCKPCMLQNIYISNEYSCSFLSSKNTETKKYYSFHKSSTTVFNTDNNKKCFQSTKSAYDFWRRMHTKVWSNGCWKFSFANTGIN